MTKRSDIHRPSAINPAEYNFVACDYYGSGLDVMQFISDRQAFRAHMERTGGTYARHEHGGTCHICGAGAMYVAKFHHVPSNTYIATGMDCADKLDMGDAVAFRNFKKRIAEGRKVAAGKAKAQAILEQAGLTAAWAIFSEPGEAKYEENVIADIVGKLVRYGSVSDKALAYVGTLLGKIANRAQIEAQRKAEAEAAAPVPTGRVTVRGKVLTVRQPDRDDVFQSVRTLIQDESGFKVWGTLPSAIADAVRGDTVEFSANVLPSKDDPKFGFYKRPTKARILEEATSCA